MKIPQFHIDKIINTALREDLTYIDTATDLLIPESQVTTGFFLAKDSGILAGIDVACRVFELIDTIESGENITVKKYFKDGDKIKNGDKLAEVTAKTGTLLKAERTALNLLCHMSGIASRTRLFADSVSGTNARIADTRKTLPGLRVLQKYAVTCGGGFNHRFNLSDSAMLKNNHIDACGGIAAAVKVLRAKISHTANIEVEVRDLKELQEAMAVGIKLIMLDNMSVTEMKKAVKLARKHPDLFPDIILEASGNVTLENVREIAETGVDIISVGGLTHSVQAFDVAFRVGC